MKIVVLAMAMNNSSIMTFPCDTIDQAITVQHNLDCYSTLEKPVIMVNNIIMPDRTDDETFFYASIDAAKNNKVWCEEFHEFTSKQCKSQFESGCYDNNDPEEDARFWIDVRLAIDLDIDGLLPVTGSDGQAIVRDQTIADKCSEWGYEVINRGNYWEIYRVE